VNLYVGNLLFDVGESELREAFEKFGAVSEVRLIMDKYSGKSKGFGFVEMPDDNEAKNAIDEMNGKEFHGREVKVSQSKPKRSGGQGGRGGPGGQGRGRGGFGGSRGRDRGGSGADSRGNR